MAEIFDLLLKPTRALFEWLLSWLAALNIEPSMWATQVAALAVLLLALWFAVRTLKALEPKDPKRLPWTVATWATGFIAAAIVIDWTVQLIYPLPRLVDGTIGIRDAPPDQSQQLFDCHVELHDFRGHRVVANSGAPETATGRFQLTFRPEFSNPPRSLVVVSNCCDTLRVPISRRELRSRQPFALTLVPR